MSLIEKKSLFDRNTKGGLGDNVGTTVPQDGTYFQDYGNSSSPFVPRSNDSDGDHLKALLTTPVASTNSGISYLPSPNGKSDFQDFINRTGDEFPNANPSLGQFGGPYKVTGPAGGFY